MTRCPAPRRATVADVNQLARARLIARGGLPRRSRTYRAPDYHRAIPLAVGEQVMLRRAHDRERHAPLELDL